MAGLAILKHTFNLSDEALCERWVVRQSYERVGKHALIAHQRDAHAKQFRRANRALKTLRTYLGRVMRDIRRKIAGDPDRQAAFVQLLSLAHAVRHQQQRQRGTCTRRRSNASPRANCTSPMS